MAWAGNIGAGGDFGSQNTWPDGTTITNHGPGSSKRASNQGYNTSSSTGGDGGKVNLKDLTAQASNVVIIGIVIAKQKPRQVQSKSNPGTDRSVFGFTLRDSPVDFINASCWGSSEHVLALSNKFRIGEIVEIKNPQVQTKSHSEIEERCRPWTPSAFQLNVSERYSTLNLYDGWHAEPFGTLQHMPIRESSDYYTLGDVLANGRNLHGEHINLLTLVKKVGTPKDIVTKGGRETKRCEVSFFDETCSSFSMVIWDEEVIDLVQQWQAKETVIFAVDVVAKYDDFRNTMVASVDSKSIFIINPDTREAHSLYKFGQSSTADEESAEETKDSVDLQAIHDVYMVDELKAKMCDKQSMMMQSDYGIVYAFLSAYDLDGPTSAVLSMRCTSCRKRVDKETGTCLNSNCSAAITDQSQAILNYDLRVNLSDLSGTINGVYVGGYVAEQIIGKSAEEFSKCCEDELTGMKWQHLLERCKVYFKIQERPGIINGSSSFLKILQCGRAEPDEQNRAPSLVDDANAPPFMDGASQATPLCPRIICSPRSIAF
ncbi:meiosis-specific with OB domain-containing protein-like [Strongylocentrotus purpuratus]|uniref:Meiosis-specific with OB domain-containing protein n=1 Tax=Strongylocentrotus purpuratus TaxID=7668 RepID=A0A7M7NU44_STRPU|nr:meiosis-specific with OB domain-containing protein-like [Strongylocentrotus purpuratus]